MDDISQSSSTALHRVDDLLRGTRRPLRRERSFSDWYSAGLAGLLVLVCLISLIVFNPWTPARCSGGSCSAAVENASAAMTLGFFLVVYLVGSLLGPVAVDAAEAFWVFSSPMGRRTLMLRRKVALLVRTSVAGVVVGFVHCGFWNANPWWIVTISTVAVAAMALALLHEGSRPLNKLATNSVIAVGAVAVAVLDLASLDGVTISSMVVPGVGALMATLALLLIGVGAWTRPERLPLSVLRRERGSRDAVTGALASADSGLLLDVIWARTHATKSFVASFTLKGAGWGAVLEAEARRCLRTPTLLVGVLLLVAWAAATSLFGHTGVLVGISLGTMVFASLNASTLRLYATSRGLARSFPHCAILMRLLLALPTALLIFGLVFIFFVVASIIPGSLLPLPNGLAVLAAVVAGLVGGVRWAMAPPTQFNAGIVMTEMGPIHVSAFMNAIRGIDASVLLALPAVVGFNPVLSLAIPAAGLLWVLARG